MNLWNNVPLPCEEIPTITPVIPEKKTSDAAVVIFPGGAYVGRAPYEGIDYARFFAENGITAFAVDYRVSPHRFPIELMDARRAVRLVRSLAAQYGLDKHKIAVMGSSAGGHLAAMVSTYRLPLSGEFTDEIDTEDYLPNAQILCYPVIIAPDEEGIAHAGSYQMLLGKTGDKQAERAVDPVVNATADTPQAFIWHTADDQAVNVLNSYRYAEALRRQQVSVEMHIFPHGPHGMGLSLDEPHVGQWKALLLNWLRYIGWINN